MGTSVLFMGLTAVATALGALVLWLLLRARLPKLRLALGVVPQVRAMVAPGYLRKLWLAVLGYWHGVQTVLSKSARARYQKTWVILLGQAGAGKSSLIASLGELRQHPDAQYATLPGVPATAWYSLPQGELIDPQGKLSAAAPDGPDAASWRSVLSAILHLRPERALDGVLLVISARSLLEADLEKCRALAIDARRQLDDLRREMSLVLPVYVVISQCDVIDGFGPFWRLSTATQRESIFGWSARDGLQQASPAQWIDEAFSDIGERLKSFQVHAAARQEQIEDVDPFFLFPRHFDQLHVPLRGYLSEVFHETAWDSTFLCRGLYFTGCTEGGSIPGGAVRSDVSFVDDLVSEKALGERGLARVTSASIWSRDQTVRSLQRGSLVAACVLLLALLWSAWRLDHKVDRLSKSIAALYQSQAFAVAQEPCTSKPLLDDGLTRAAAMDTDLVFLAMPWGLFDRRASNNAVQVVSGAVMARTVFPALACALQARAAGLVAELFEASDPTPAGIAGRSSYYWKTRARLKVQAMEVRNFEDNLKRFERLTAIPAESVERKLENLNLLYLYLYGAGLPAAATDPYGVVAKALAQVPYSAGVAVPARMRVELAQQLGNSSDQLHAALLREVRNGPALLSQLDAAKAPLVENTRHFTAWLEWVGNSWLPSDPENNPCADTAKELEQLFRPLVNVYKYPSSLLTNISVFNATNCYEKSMPVLRHMSLSPYGPLLIKQGLTLVLNPKLPEEVRGLTALLKQSYMQVLSPQDFACFSAAPVWRVADLGKAMNYAAEYQKFALAQDLAPLRVSAAASPLFDRVAKAQLRQVMNDAMRSPSPAEDAAPFLQGLDVVSVADQQLLQQSSDFSRALEPLLSVLRLYNQFGFDASGKLVTKCARDFASESLGRISGLVSASRLYDPEAGPPDGLLVNLGSTPVIRDYLDRQVARAQVLTGYADPFVNLLRNTDGVNDVMTDKARTLPYWSNTINELTRYVQFKEPGGQVAALDTLFLKTVADLNYVNCGKTLAAYQPAEDGNDMFAVRRKKLLKQLSQRCVNRSAEQAASGYSKLAERFTQELAGRFPFGELGSPDASLATTKAFFIDYAAQRDALQQSLANLRTQSWAESARNFLSQLDAADQFLRAGLGIVAPAQPIKLDVTFRALPKLSPGSEQVVSWVLSSGPRVSSYPSLKPATLDWSFGQVLTLDLNWAELSVWRPGNNPVQSGYGADGSTATFVETSDWALLRMMQRYKPKQPGVSDPLNPDRVLLEFTVPTLRLDGPAGAAKTGQATLYLGLNLSGIDPKSQSTVALRWPGVFPRSAPQP